MLFSVQNEVVFSNFVRKQNVESENFPINPINVFFGDLRFFFVTGKENLGTSAAAALASAGMPWPRRPPPASRLATNGSSTAPPTAATSTAAPRTAAPGMGPPHQGSADSFACCSIPPPKTHGGEGEKFVRLALSSALFSVIQQYLD